MLMKNCNAFDFAHKQIFNSYVQQLRWGPFKVGRPCAFAHFAHF